MKQAKGQWARGHSWCLSFCGEDIRRRRRRTWDPPSSGLVAGLRVNSTDFRGGGTYQGGLAERRGRGPLSPLAPKDGVLGRAHAGRVSHGTVLAALVGQTGILTGEGHTDRVASSVSLGTQTQQPGHFRSHGEV